MKESMKVKAFAESAPDLYILFKDYFNHTQHNKGIQGKTFGATSIDEKEVAINKAFCAELEKKVPRMGLDDTHYAVNPVVKSFADAMVDTMIDMILPETLLQSVGLIADIRFLDWGDSANFELENNALFNVAKADYRQKNAVFQRLENTNATLVPVAHQVSVISNLFNVLTGRDSIAKYVMKAVRSIESAMLAEAYTAFVTAVTAGATPSALKVANYAETSAITLAETVSAWNQGKKAVFVGTPVALKALLPSNSNYRYTLNDEFVKMGYIPTFNTYDVVPMEQIADYTSTTYGLKLDNTKIFVVSPASDKIIKIAVGGTLSVNSGVYENANLAQTGSVMKAWEVGAITNSIAGYIGTTA